MLVCAVLLVDVVVRGGAGQAILIAPWLLLVLWAAYVLSFASHLSTDEYAITVQNLLRRTRVPWGRVTGIELRWQVVITLDDGSIVRSFGGPSPTRGGMLHARAAPDRGAEQTGHLVDAWIAAGEAETGPVTRGWDVPALVALLIIGTWAVLAIAWGAG